MTAVGMLMYVKRKKVGIKSGQWLFHKWWG